MGVSPHGGALAQISINLGQIATFSYKFIATPRDAIATFFIATSRGVADYLFIATRSATLRRDKI